MLLQIGEAKEILAIGREEITVAGILLLIIAGLGYASVYFVKKYNKSMEERLNDVKEFNKTLTEINEEVNDSLNKVLSGIEVLKQIINVNSR